MYIGAPHKPTVNHKKAYTGTAGTIDDPITDGVTVIRVLVTSAAHIAIGANPTATTADMLLPANSPEYFLVPMNSKVSAVQASAGGDLHVTEMTR